MAGISMKITGTAQISADLRKKGAQSAKAVQSGNFALGLQIEAAAAKKAPIKYGVLRASGYVIPSGKSYKVGFGQAPGGTSPAAKYAWIQHEMPFHHPRGGEDHYLSKAVDEIAPQAMSIFKAAYDKAMKGGAAAPGSKQPSVVGSSRTSSGRHVGTRRKRGR